MPPPATVSSPFVRRLAVRPALLWAGALLLRLAAGPAADPAVAAAAVVAWLGGGARPPGRVALAAGLLALIALLQVVLPGGAPPARLSLPQWARELVAPLGPRWSLAPWETLRWVMLLAGAGVWAAALGGDRRVRRRQLAAFRWVAVVVAAGVLWHRLEGRSWPAGANHAGVLLAAAAAEPVMRFRTGQLLPAVTLVPMAAALVVLQSWAALALAGLATVWAGLVWKVPERRRPWRRTVAALAAAVVLAVLLGRWLPAWPALEGLQVRLRFWQDLGPMLADALPWGMGFGSFRWVYPPYSVHLPLPAVRALHPENGLLWLLLAGGLPALGALAVLLPGVRRRRGLAAAGARAGVAVLAVHSLIDVAWLWTPVLWSLPLLAVTGWAWGRDRRPPPPGVAVDRPAAELAAATSVLIPVLNEADNLRRLLPELSALGVAEVVVADGGSTDGTREVAVELGARVIEAPPGRGSQLLAAVAAAGGEVLWIVHADSRPPAAPFAAMAPVLRRGEAGAFRLVIDHPGWAFRVVELGARIRNAATGIPYGDQGVFLSRGLYAAAGGFPPWPLMEDIALGQRIRDLGRRIEVVDAAIGTSPRRWLRDGVVRRTLKNWGLALRYQTLGADPYELARSYRPEPPDPDPRP